ncbi:tail completion protein gp17 [Altererythrobacter aquiaggeris]|uniref:tail completion protein gp17 n=1 Tax=Aestuarierythrobacter aquiaggeris TaxID=1898396 RepID=UPI003019306C
MEIRLRSALLEWLEADELLSGMLNSVTEEAPLSATAPWLGIIASASTEWGSKDRRGHEILIALELSVRSDAPASGSDIVTLIDKRIDALPRQSGGLEIVTARFLRARAERRPRNLRSILLEYRFRVLETLMENVQ